MPQVKSSRTRLLLITLFVVFISACGGGGGSSSPPVTVTPPPPPPPTPKTISGIVTLGPVAGADIEISGTGGSLGTGTTAADGSFGPISYDGAYDGPIRITATGTASSTWTCDFLGGCSFDGVLANFGDNIAFNGTLESVVASSVTGEFVSVSLLSDFVASRTDTLGGLTAANVNAAYADISDLIRSTIGDVLTSQAITLPNNFGSIELFDLQNLPAPGGSNDALSMLLSLLNSGLIGLSDESLGTGEFIETLSSAVAAQPVLPNFQEETIDPSVSIFITAFRAQLIRSSFTTLLDSDMIDSLLEPANLVSTLSVASTTLSNLPQLTLQTDSLSLFLDNATVAGFEPVDLLLSSSTGESVAFSEVEATIDSDSGVDWFSVEPVEVDGVTFLRVDLDRDLLQGVPNGFYEVTVNTRHISGQFRDHELLVFASLEVFGPQVEAGLDFSTLERSNVTLAGFTDRPEQLQSIRWSQTSGTPVAITNEESFEPTIDFPNIDESETITLQLDVTFTTGESASDFITIFVQAYELIANLQLSDAALQQCVSDFAANSNISDTGEVETLTCTGISDVTGLGLFPNLTSLNLPGNLLSSLTPVLGLSALEFLDISGNSRLSCSEVDTLAMVLTEGSELLVDDICVGASVLELGEAGFDTALDVARNQVYVSVPARREIAVISLAELRIVDRLVLPGEPYGIDLSIDGTRLFAALNGSNSVAVIDIEQRSVETIDLGAEPDHPSTYDVIEGAPGRLFVSANPGSGGFAYITQVLLDQGNLVSRVASGK